MGRKVKSMNFRSRRAYGRWLAYGHIHSVFKRRKGNVRVSIRGRRRRVSHLKGRSRL